MDRRTMIAKSTTGGLGALVAGGLAPKAKAETTAPSMTLLALRDFAQNMLDLGYDPGTPVSKAIAGDPRDPESLVVAQDLTWLKPVATAPTEARGVSIAAWGGSAPGDGVRLLLA